MKTGLLLSLRQIARHPWQTVISVVGIAAGVAAVLAIDLVNSSAERGFRLAGESVAAGATHRILAASGRMNEGLFPELEKKFGLSVLVPVVSGDILMPDERTYRLAGIEPLAWLGDNRPGDDTVSFDASPVSLIGKPGTAFISDSLADQYAIEPPADILISTGTSRHVLHIIGIFDDGNGITGADLITDISTAQDVLEMTGWLTEMELSPAQEQIEEIRSILPDTVQLIGSTARSEAVDAMTRAFRTNLTALSLLALVIGAFLVYNTMTIAVLQRRGLIATLRTLGMSRAGLTGSLLVEVLLLAAAGILLGFVFGTGLSFYLVRLASQTISDLYFAAQVQDLHLNPWSFSKGAATGLLATLIAVFLPLREACSVSPELTRSRSRLETATRRQQGLLCTISLLFALSAVLVILTTETSIIAGFVALFFIILAFAMLVPFLLVLLIRLANQVAARLFGLIGSIACRSILSSLSRTRIAVAALSIAVAATIGVSIMIGSFRQSVETWLDDSLGADVYISASGRAGNDAVDASIEENLKHLPGIVSVSGRKQIEFWHEDKFIRMYVTNMGEKAFVNYRFKDDGTRDRWQRFYGGDNVIVSEPYASHNRIGTGDLVILPAGVGEKKFRVAGVYRDYSSSIGAITMHEKTYEKYWEETGATSLSVFLDSDIDAGLFAENLNGTLLQGSGLRARSRHALLEASMEIFDRTFTITNLLRVLTIIIAAIGILGALMAIQLERRQESAVLRVLGLTPRDLKILLLSEGGIMGLAAGLLAVPLGIILAVMLIHVINRRSFGWTIETLIDPGYLVAAVILGTFSGLLAAVFPARALAGSSPIPRIQNGQ